MKNNGNQTSKISFKYVGDLNGDIALSFKPTILSYANKNYFH